MLSFFHKIRYRFRQLKGHYYAKRKRWIAFQRKRDVILRYFFLPLLFPKYILEQLSWGFVPRFDQNFMKTESPLERRLYCLLRKVYKGTVIAQYPYGHYYIDFALTELKIALEADGKTYHSSEKQKAKDKRKTDFLRKRGWIVKRFSTNRIVNNEKRVMEEITNAITKRMEETMKKTARGGR